MADTQFTIGADVRCSDGVCGEVRRVVVDPVVRTVTHLVVEPKHRRWQGRLVPLDLVDASDGEVTLRCTEAEFENLDPAEETQFVPGGIAEPGYGPEDVLAWPYYGFGGLSGGLGGGLGVPGAGGMSVPQTVTRETVPLGEVDIRRGEHVHATDGSIGRVQGLVIDPGSRHVTHVLLQEGHLWGSKEVAIPISAVTDVDDGVRLSITKEDVGKLPEIDIDHPAA